MKSSHERPLTCSSTSSSDYLLHQTPEADFSNEVGVGDDKLTRGAYWSSLLAPAFSIFENKPKAHGHGWSEVVRKVVTVRSMWRLHDRVLGTFRTGVSSSNSDIWLLGVPYKIDDGLAAFELDFSSRILMTYRKGFDAIKDSNFTSDVNWGCMLRSGQMLVAQALLFHHLGRSWRKPPQKPFDQDYIEILHYFGDSEASSFSIHNLIQAGKAYGLAAGSWVGPYAMCRSWETVARSKREETELDKKSLPMAVYVVSGDEDGERGGAPVVCIEDASRHCFEFSKGQCDWSPILLLVPLVLGLDKINPRYIPSLRETFTFPQSLGILGGKPGASTYIVGVQDEKAYYLDPHDVQQVVDIPRDDLEADTSSYHCSIVRHIPLESIDPSLAIGFYCRDKDEFEDFCCRASMLADQSNGAPLFTVAHCQNLPKAACHNEISGKESQEDDDSYDVVTVTDDTHEDDWQLL